MKAERGKEGTVVIQRKRLKKKKQYGEVEVLMHAQCSGTAERIVSAAQMIHVVNRYL